MVIVEIALPESDIELELKSVKIAKDIKAQLEKQNVEVKIVKEIE